MVFLVTIEQVTEMPFAEHSNMVKTIPSIEPASPNIRFAMATVTRSADRGCSWPSPET